MLRSIIVVSLLGAFEYHTCRGDTQSDDWRNQGYRPRRNFNSQSQNENFQANNAHNYQSQNAFRSDQSSTGSSYSQNSTAIRWLGAKATPVPEPDGDDGDVIDDFTTTTKWRGWRRGGGHGAMAKPVPEPDDDDNDVNDDFTTTKKWLVWGRGGGFVSRAIPVPEPDDDDDGDVNDDFTTTKKWLVWRRGGGHGSRAMPVPEPDDDGDEEDDPTTPSTTTSTTPTTTTTTTTTPSTTTSTTPPTSTTTTTTSTTSTTTPVSNRNLIEEESSYSPPPDTTTPSTTTFKAPEYLPPDNTTQKWVPPPPAPAMAMAVPPEPECDPLDPSTYPSAYLIDHRWSNFGGSPCDPPTTTTTLKPPYRGPLYLPPPPEEHLCEPKTRIRRSTEDTLRLADLTGTPRPVWYAGIYKKVTDPYYPICGGSIIREDIVISAAHCFWDDVGGKQAAELFAVAARKIYKPWKDPMDKKAQKSDVSEITIPPRYLGVKASFQEDLALLKLATPFKYTRSLRPICVDFDEGFDSQQLKSGHYGTIAGWGGTDSKGTPTQRLLWFELPYIEIEKCISDSDESFLKYITSDKVCAGENDTGRALCRGDSGGGLAFWQGPGAHATPYLRGVASTAPQDKSAACNVYAYGSFTWLYAHRTFLRKHLPGIDTCRFWE